MDRELFAGAAVATPLNSDLSIDHGAMVDHLQGIGARGIDLMTMFGTSGEGASFTSAERNSALQACSNAGIGPDRLGTGLFDLVAANAGEAAKAAFDSGCGHVLLAPPSYYKGMTDDGLFDWFSQAIEAMGPNPGKVVLYHIPSVTTLPLSIDLITRLSRAFPGVVWGVKDSSGDWPNTEKLIKARGDLKILVGHDGQVEKGVLAGSSGCIAGGGNFLPEVINSIVHQNATRPEVDDLITRLFEYPLIPALKAITAHRTGHHGWARVRPPMSSVTPELVAPLCAWVDEVFPA